MGLTENERDIILWNRVKNGDEEAFATLFRNYYPNLFNYGCKITRERELVEDCIQELFLEIWRSGRKIDIIAMRAYIFKAFKFKLVRLIAKSNKIKSITDNNDENGFELSHENFLIDEELNVSKKKKYMTPDSYNSMLIELLSTSLCFWFI